MIINSSRAYSKPSLWHILKSILTLGNTLTPGSHAVTWAESKFEFRPTQNDFIGWLSESVCDKQGCQPPTSSNIENWWGVGDRWHHNAGHMKSFFGEKKAQKRCCFNCNIWPNWFTFHQSHYCLYYNGILAFVWKRSFINRKIAQTVQNIWNFIVGESNLQEMANFGDYPRDFRL